MKIDGTQYLNDTMSDNIDTGANLWIFASDFPSGNKIPSKSRLYSLKLWQGDANGDNMRLVRDFKPVRLSNGLVVLWDFKNDKPYLPQSTTDPYDCTTFPAVGPDGERIYTSTRIILR